MCVWEGGGGGGGGGGICVLCMVCGNVFIDSGIALREQRKILLTLLPGFSLCKGRAGNKARFH